MGENDLAKRIALTAGALLIYKAADYIPIPIVDLAALRELHSNGAAARIGSIMSLGIAPFVSGFFAVELYSLLTPWGRRVRRDGANGRKELNEWAKRISFLICVIQSFAVMFALETMTTPGGLRLVPDPGLTSRAIGIVTITAASASVFLLCNVITIRGIGNGFCLLVIVDVAATAASRWRAVRASWEPQSVAFYLLAFFAIVLLFIYSRRPEESYHLHAEDLSSTSIRLPSFPQGIVPVAWSYTLLNLPDTLAKLLHRGDSLVPGPISYLAGVIVAVPLFSFAAVHLFSSRRRIESNLSGWLSDEFTTLLKSSLTRSTATLAVAVTAFTALELYVFSGYRLPGFFDLALVAVIGIDLHEEWHFRARHASAERLIELDNVHLASQIKAVLEDGGIECLVQAFYFRSLFFFFRPLYKMAVLVPADRLEEAQKELERVVIRVV